MKNLLFLFIFALPILSIAQPVINSVTENSTSIERYNKLELAVNLTASFTNAYDYSEINLQTIFTAPSGAKDTVDGFYIQDYTIIDQSLGTIAVDGAPQWKVRFSPTEIGQWQYQVYCVNQNGTSNILTQNFDCVTSNSKGYIQKANNMFMKYDDGSQFFGIGENLCWNVNTTGGVNVNQTFVNYSEWIDTLTTYNGNFFRVWMSDWAFSLEWDDTGLRNYAQRQDNAFYLDWVVEYAESKNTAIELCLNHHGQFVASGADAIWYENPYNSANGGPCATSTDFFTNNTAKNHYKNRLRYINARWGYSTSIFAWEQFNEMDLIGNYWPNRTAIANWTIEMASYIKSIDVNKHLNSTSFVQDNQGFDIWNAPVIDYTQTHHYSADAEIELALNNRSHTFLTDYNKPTKIGEYSLSTNGANIVIGYDNSAIHIHNATWSTAVSGSFSISMSWWWKWYVHNQNLQAYKSFKEVGNFMSSIDLLASPLTPKNFDCETNTNSAFSIIPLFTWGVSPANTFTVNTNGALTPSPTNLSTFLYGDGTNTNLKNPPTLNVNYPQAGFFTVKTANNTGFNPTIEIWLDGVKMLDQAAVINTDYTINVPAGTHQIFIDNKGHDWIEISRYYSSFGATVNAKSNGLMSSKSAYGWVHNKDYNWNYIATNGLPNSITNARVVILGLDDGNYEIVFYNTLTGATVSQNIVLSSNGNLYANIPDMLWDYSFKITEAIATSASKAIKETSDVVLFPNPASSKLTIKGIKGKAHITIFDICGKVMMSKELTRNTIDISSLKKGSYIVNITTATENINRKIIKE